VWHLWDQRYLSVISSLLDLNALTNDTGPLRFALSFEKNHRNQMNKWMRGLISYLLQASERSMMYILSMLDGKSSYTEQQEYSYQNVPLSFGPL
jgi:hypothetical protein